MQTIFNPYLKDSFFFHPEQMYGKDRRVFEELSHIVNGNIYFLAERCKVRIIPESIVLSTDGHISVSFLLKSGRQIPARFPFAPTIIGLGSKFKEFYGDELNLQKYVIGVRSQDEYLSKQAMAHDLPFIGVSLDKGAQTKKNIAVSIHTPDGRIGNLAFSLHSILSLFKIDIGDYPHVIYIGKSEHLEDRIYRHERIQEALAVIEDDSELYLYAFQFDAHKYIASNLNGHTAAICKTEVEDISASAQVSLIEMALINYFKPVLNENHKHSDITANPVFVALLKRKYNQMVVEVDYDSGFWNFGSDHIKSSLRHQIEYPVVN